MIADLKPYPAMKDSGVEWLGAVPEHWEVRRLRNTSEMRVSNVDKHAKDDEQPVRLCNYVDVYKNERIRSGMAFMRATATTDEIERFRLQSGDVLITKDSEAWNDIGVPALVEDTQDDIVSGYHLALLRPFPERVDGGYLFRALQSTAVTYQFHVEANGVTRYGLSHSAIKSVWLPLAPLPEQSAIVRYLDHVDQRIRRYIRANQKLIKLLEEQKQALIHRAVTRGLDPNVRLKPSGVEWLGDVPKHWEVNKVTRLFSIGSGSTPPTEHSEYYGGGIPWITTSELREAVVGATKKTITEEALKAFPTLNIYPEGSIVIAMYGATIGRLGILGVPAAVNQACCVFSAPNGMYAWFWFYWFQSKRRYLISLGYGGGQPNLSQELLKSLRVPTPSFAEQRTISAYLDKATSDIADAVNRAHREIDLLREYHTRLIADVVTGKLDVRESAAQLPDEVEELEPLDEAEVIINGEEEPRDGLDTTLEEATV